MIFPTVVYILKILFDFMLTTQNYCHKTSTKTIYFAF